MKSFVLALQFLTRLYLPWNIDGEENMFARSMKFFPAAGLVIGLLEAGVLWISLRAFSPWSVAVLLTMFDAVITGGLHLDGLADTIDGLSSHRDKERMLEIMKDSRIGTFGVLALIGTLAVRTCMYQDLMLYEQGWLLYGIVAAVPVISRTVMAFLIFISRYAREEGMGGLFFRYKGSMNIWVTLILGVLLAAVGAWYAPVLLVFGFLAGFCMRGICYHKIGGMTGDTLGASLEIVEVVMLMAAAVAARFIF